jgi:hypothetical protein
MCVEQWTKFGNIKPKIKIWKLIDFFDLLNDLCGWFSNLKIFKAFNYTTTKAKLTLTKPWIDTLVGTWNKGAFETRDGIYKTEESEDLGIRMGYTKLKSQWILVHKYIRPHSSSPLPASRSVVVSLSLCLTRICTAATRVWMPRVVVSHCIDRFLEAGSTCNLWPNVRINEE